MPTTVEIKGEFELKIKRLIDAGLYGNIAEAVRDALRHMLREYDEKEMGTNINVTLPDLIMDVLSRLNEESDIEKTLQDVETYR